MTSFFHDEMQVLQSCFCFLWVVFVFSFRYCFISQSEARICCIAESLISLMSFPLSVHAGGHEEMCIQVAARIKDIVEFMVAIDEAITPAS